MKNYNWLKLISFFYILKRFIIIHWKKVGLKFKITLKMLFFYVKFQKIFNLVTMGLNKTIWNGLLLELRVSLEQLCYSFKRSNFKILRRTILFRLFQGTLIKNRFGRTCLKLNLKTTILVSFNVVKCSLQPSTIQKPFN